MTTEHNLIIRIRELEQIIQALQEDKKRLDWLEEMGNGIAVIHNDFQHWAVDSNGIQNLPDNLSQLWDLETTYFIEDKKFQITIRDAIDKARQSEEYNG